jgi:hypothetical protein
MGNIKKIDCTSNPLILFSAERVKKVFKQLFTSVVSGLTAAAFAIAAVYSQAPPG